jgi:hypothetical protein
MKNGLIELVRIKTNVAAATVLNRVAVPQKLKTE